MPLVTGSSNLLTYQFNSIVANSPTDVWAVGGSGDNALEQGGSPSTTLIEHGTARRGPSCRAHRQAPMTTSPA